MLTPTEFRMLAAITSRPGEVVRRRAVVAAAWPDGAMVNENTVDSYVRRIRVKLDEVRSPLSLQTVRGVGFTLSDDVAHCSVTRPSPQPDRGSTVALMAALVLVVGVGLQILLERHRAPRRRPGARRAGGRGGRLGARRRPTGR